MLAQAPARERAVEEQVEASAEAARLVATSAREEVEAARAESRSAVRQAADAAEAAVGCKRGYKSLNPRLVPIRIGEWSDGELSLLFT